MNKLDVYESQGLLTRKTLADLADFPELQEICNRESARLDVIDKETQALQEKYNKAATEIQETFWAKAETKLKEKGILHKEYSKGSESFEALGLKDKQFVLYTPTEKGLTVLNIKPKGEQA